jgi:hypothetical protein
VGSLDTGDAMGEFGADAAAKFALGAACALDTTGIAGAAAGWFRAAQPAITAQNAAAIAVAGAEVRLRTEVSSSRELAVAAVINT